MNTFYQLVQDLESRGPLTGLGLFSIERSTLTAMLSVSLTYIIILIQFKMSTMTDKEGVIANDTVANSNETIAIASNKMG